MAEGTDASSPKSGDALSADDIALLCDIGDSFPAEVDGEKKRRLSRLIAAGYVTRADPGEAPEKYKLTAKAQKLLSERGAGLNES